MIGHLRVKSPWAQLGIFLLVFSPQLLLSLASLFVNVKTNIDLSNPTVITKMKLQQAGFSVIYFLLPAFLFTVFTFRGNYLYFLGFKKAEKTNMYVLGALCMLLALPFVFLLNDINQSIQLPIPSNLKAMEEETMKHMIAFLKVNHPIDIVINVLIIAVLPAVCEEVFFRGVLQRILIHATRSPWAGIIITAILFSALHMQFQGFLPRMFLGMVLGALYWYSGSLWTSILAHFVNNAVQVIAISYAPQYIDKNPDAPLLAAIVSGIVVWAILWFYARQSSVTFAKVYRTNDLTSTNQFIA
jgi:membrane protease YdiL (CAAX protease family)